MGKTNNGPGPHWFPFSWNKRPKPILGPAQADFFSRNVYEPSVLYDGKTSLMLFRGESRNEAPMQCVGRLGVAVSGNGYDFEFRKEPALVPDSPFESHGIAHPRLCLAGGVFLLTYAAYDGKRYRLTLATSTDTKSWYRGGNLFPELTRKGEDVTSASIIPVPSSDGRYYMLVGAGDLYMASSTDLLHWELNTKPVLKRKKALPFASERIETGPSPFVTRHGIVAILNGVDDCLCSRPFAALFDLQKPENCLAHLKEPFMGPEADWERFGYVPDSIRVTGLSLREDTFHLYYSGADRCIGSATARVPVEYFEEPMETESDKKARESRPKVCGV